MNYYVYVLASKRNGTLYIGVTNNLVRRVWEHRNDMADGFTKKYGVHRLVYYEQTESVEAAIQREKRLKKWDRAGKIRLIAAIPARSQLHVFKSCYFATNASGFTNILY